jgi:hypothetical protein
MRRAKVTEKLGLAASVLAISCGSDHRVSPWGGGEPPPLATFAQAPDLAAQLRAVDQEAEALGLRRTAELRLKLRHGRGEVVIRGYAGTDAIGRPTSAVRVATPQGVVMAVGPLASGDRDRSRATELVISQSGADADDNGEPDIVLRNEAGALEFWTIPLSGKPPYRSAGGEPAPQPVTPATKAPAVGTPAGK